MQILLTIAAAAAAVAATPAPVTRSDPVVVRAVLDGDTIDVATVGRVRLLGIDAPELSHGFDTAAPFGREARDRLVSLVLRRWVRLEYEGTRLDVYNRHLAYVVREDGLFVNAVMVSEGLARVTSRVPLSRLSELQRAEAAAQSFRRGMWGETPHIPETSVTGKRLASKSGRRYTRSSKKSRARRRKTPPSQGRPVQRARDSRRIRFRP